MIYNNNIRHIPTPFSLSLQDSAFNLLFLIVFNKTIGPPNLKTKTQSTDKSEIQQAVQQFTPQAPGTERKDSGLRIQESLAIASEALRK